MAAPSSSSEKAKKGILKATGSVENHKKELEWDEMNIIATYHPADKDYGHMKVDEAPTPFNRAAISDSDDEKAGSINSNNELDPEQLALRLESDIGSSVDRKYYQDEEDDDADYENMTEEEKIRRKAFLMKRKMHYNEFAAVQLAKKLMDEDEDDEGSATTPQNKVATSSSSTLQSKGSGKGKKSSDKMPAKKPDKS
ncbi:hypothetical protein BsWGS_19236 [Bradybaena similaris]